MDLAKEVTATIQHVIGEIDIDSSLDTSLKSLGVSSIDFLKIIIPLSKKANIRLQDLDPLKVSTNMTTRDLIAYLIHKTLSNV